jgi:LacI family transcriptional regulator
MTATISQIAKEANVSVALVSRFLNEDPSLRIREEKRQRILKVKERLGGVRTSRAARITPCNIVFPIVRDRFSESVQGTLSNIPLTRNFELGLKRHGYRLSFTCFDVEHKTEYFKELVQSPAYCDGLFLSGESGDEEIAELVLSKGFPHVSAHRLGEARGLNSVTAYTIGGLRQAIEHLTELGHRRIGYVGSKLVRYPLFVAMMTEAGLPFDERFNCECPWPARDIGVDWASPKWREIGKESFARWWENGKETTAVICQNDMTAIGVIEAMREKGLTPGRDLSVVGYDNVEVRGPDPSEHPTLTTIDNPMDLIGRRCAEVLMDQILRGRREIVHEHVAIRLIVRETTGPCRK